MRSIAIGKKYIGDKHPVFIVAELSANHLQQYDLAEKTILAIKESGADAVKLQTYTPDTLTIKCDKSDFMIKDGSPWEGESLYGLYEKAYTPWEWQPKLKRLAEDLGLIFFSTPFDVTAVDFLEELDVPVYKIASFEIFDTLLIEYIASKKKPVILSTGMAHRDDIKRAIAICKINGVRDIILLKCTSAYPAPYDDMNLRAIPRMIKEFSSIVGLSDHSPGIEVPLAAVSLGAKMVEKHFILDRKIDSPDASFSLEPQEFTRLVRGIRNVEKALGEEIYTKADIINKNKQFCRSLYIIEDINAGEQLTEQNVKSIRPGFGLHPMFYKDVIGKKALSNIKKGTPLSWELIEKIR